MSNKAIFLDLQGSLGGHPYKVITNFFLYPSSIEALKIINASEYLCIIITNQSKIAKGYLSLESF